MNRVEKAIVLTSLVYTALYIPFFFSQVFWRVHESSVSFAVIIPLHLLGMALNLAALIVIIRDLFLRPFADPNAKLIWLLLILFTGPIGFILYLFKYAFNPRTLPDGA